MACRVLAQWLVVAQWLDVAQWRGVASWVGRARGAPHIEDVQLFLYMRGELSLWMHDESTLTATPAQLT